MTPPFAGRRLVDVLLPRGDDAPTRSLRALLRLESAELAAELGAPVRLRTSGDGGPPAGADATLLIGPADRNAEIAAWRTGRVAASKGRVLGAEPQSPAVDVTADVVVVAAPGPEGIAGVAEALSLLRTSARTGAERTVATDAGDVDQAVERITAEVGSTYPSFGLRRLSWPRLVERFAPEALAVGGDLAVLQRWLATLRDPHTAVHVDGPRAFLPYTAHVGPVDVRLGHVPRWSAGYAAGARRGDRLVVAGEVLDPAAVLATSAGEERTRGWFAGRRALTVATDVVRVEVERTTGRRVAWEEPASVSAWPESVSWTRLASGSGYLRVRAWTDTSDWADAVDAALGDLAGSEHLIVDLRGNVGGSLVAATAFGDRFVPSPLRRGTVRFSTVDGALTAPEPILGSPDRDDLVGRVRWRRPVRFLVDRLSYSATEDAILGLSQLDGIEVWGEDTGGGSGRPRTIRLMPGTRMSVSTALTFDHRGRVVEGAGIRADVVLPPDLLAGGAAVHAADRSW